MGPKKDRDNMTRWHRQTRKDKTRKGQDKDKDKDKDKGKKGWRHRTDKVRYSSTINYRVGNRKKGKRGKKPKGEKGGR